MRIGVIGAGQLGQMLGEAGKEMGIECRFIDPSESPPAASVGSVIRKPFDDPEALAALASDCDVVSFEFENVPVEALHAIEDVVAVYPPPAALAIAQDRLLEKQLFDELGISLPTYRAVDSLQDLKQAVADLGCPCVVKTRRFGYDGKGQFVIREERQVDQAWAELGDRPLIVESFVAFDYEVSVIGVRNPTGEIAVWPLSQNEHAEGILRTSQSPVDNPALIERASEYMNRMLQHLDYVGVLALELFVAGDALLANEFAPRVHNSGHWTIEGATTSQFTNHLLAITGQAPGSTQSIGYAGMINLIGDIPACASGMATGSVSLHDYGKAPRPGRKLGHITIVAESASERDRLVSQITHSVTQSTSL
jgi:5-(carboxyamino)imidazole ribonucleotide synthase